LSIAELENSFKSSLESGALQKAKEIIKKNPKIIKIFGAQVWSYALNSKNQHQAVRFLISIKAPVHMPKSNAKKVAALSDYTLMLSIKHKSNDLLKYLLENYKINKKLLNDSIIHLCNSPYFTEQISMLYNLIDGEGDPTSKNDKAMFYATLANNGNVIEALVEKGSYLINKSCAEIFLRTTNQDPLTYLSICEDERSHSALISVMSGDNSTETPIDHFE
jgi:hypothetical protein